MNLPLTSVHKERSSSVAYADSKRITRAWEHFLSNGVCASDAVRSVILNSWKRSVELGVPTSLREVPLEVCSEEGLHSLQHRHRDFQSAAFRVVAPLLEMLSQSNSLFAIADARGVIIKTLAAESAVDKANECNVQPGANWGEEFCGTNAIGTALHSGQPTQVVTSEHYCEGMKRWSCATAIVRDPVDREIVGIVDISSLSNTLHVHSLALVVSIANQIETILSTQEIEYNNRLLEWCRPHAERWANDGRIVLDKKGRIVDTSRNVETLLPKHGIGIDSFAKSRLSQSTIDSAEANYPEGIKREWIHPAVIDGEHFGSLIVIPHQREPRPINRPAEQFPFFNGSRNKQYVNPFGRIVHRSPVMVDVIGCAERLARSTAPILIEGETGVGKEEFAKSIHDASPFFGGPFIAVNCGALAKDLVASELFGYVDGAFTGARRGGRVGKFEAADGGTLFLDEIGELPLEVQAYLLRVLQDGKVTRIGANSVKQANTRVLAATNRNLLQDVGEKRFRGDLYYRLSVAKIVIPPLRDRREDIEILVRYFIEMLSQKYSHPSRTIGSDLVMALEAYDWPGNVRELGNVLERMWLLSDKNELARIDLPIEIRCRGASQGDPTEVSIDAKSDITLRSLEREAIIAAIIRCDCNMNKTAKSLGISRSTLYEKVARYGIIQRP